MRVAVFAGSSPGPETHRVAVVAFVERLAGAGMGIVYGGARVGLMGVVADTALRCGAEVVGVVPRHLALPELVHQDLTRLEVVADMHERKARMADLADACVALPGGSGTLEELFEVWSWGHLGLHAKPTALFDLDGFYRPLLEQLEVMCAAGYLNRRFLDALGVVPDADAFLEFVAAYQHPDPNVRRRRAGETAA
jgi:uncharacterized protein (TIGR00730 family)